MKEEAILDLPPELQHKILSYCSYDDLGCWDEISELREQCQYINKERFAKFSKILQECVEYSGLTCLVSRCSLRDAVTSLVLPATVSKLTLASLRAEIAGYLEIDSNVLNRAGNFLNRAVGELSPYIKAIFQLSSFFGGLEILFVLEEDALHPGLSYSQVYWSFQHRRGELDKNNIPTWLPYTRKIRNTLVSRPLSRFEKYALVGNIAELARLFHTYMQKGHPVEDWDLSKSLRLACATGKVETVELLLWCGAKVSKKCFRDTYEGGAPTRSQVVSLLGTYKRSGRTLWNILIRDFKCRRSKDLKDLQKKFNASHSQFYTCRYCLRSLKGVVRNETCVDIRLCPGRQRGLTMKAPV